MGWRITIDQISGAGGRDRFEYTSSSPIELAIAGALAQAGLRDVVAGQYQITAVPSSVSDDIQRQLGVCPGCGKSETVVNTESDRFECRNVDRGPGRGSFLGCGARWRGARLGTPA